MAKKRLLIILLVALLAATASGFYLKQSTGQKRPRFAHSHVTITRADGRIFPFEVDVALSPDEQACGLMFVTSLDADRGMVFPSDPPRPVFFWMKNTLIPLDMLFIGPDHKIARIVANAQPNDLTPIPSGDPVSAVIEIKGGQAEIDGLAVGDKVDRDGL